MPEIKEVETFSGKALYRCKFCGHIGWKEDCPCQGRGYPERIDTRHIARSYGVNKMHRGER